MPSTAKRSTSVLLLMITIHLKSAKPQQCQIFDDPLVSEICGYNYTLKFEDQKLYRGQVELLVNLRSNACSKYTNLMLCSKLLPRCIEGLDGPYLPCKRVCDEFAKECRASGNTQEDSLYILQLCHLLPEYDDPKTTKGYLGRCFEPPRFKPSSEADLQCFKLGVPVCQGLGYDETTLPQPLQKRRAASLPYYINKESDCGHLEWQFFCVRFIKPCKEHKLLVLCRHHCERILKTCRLKRNIDDGPFDQNFCQKFPKGGLSSELCYITDWPFVEHWPKPMVYMHSTGTPSAVSSSTQLVSEHPMKVVIPAVVSVSVVLAIALVLMLLFVRQKRQQRRNGYENSTGNSVLEIQAGEEE